MPCVDPETVDVLGRAYAAGAGQILAASVDGQRGNPVLFDRAYFESLSELQGDVGGRSMLTESEDAALVATGDPGVVQNIDRPADRRRYANR